MGKNKIGIIFCGNSGNDLNCNSAMCLHDFQHRTGAFGMYNGNSSELLGIISCAGCPTLAAPDKILHRVGGLVELGMDSLHMSSCMMALCPFKNKYKGIIEKNYPGVKIIEGTHLPPEGVSQEDAGKKFMENAHDMICQPRPSMSKLALLLYPGLV